MFRMDEFSTIDWDSDEILKKQSDLDARVEQMLEATAPSVSEFSVNSPSSYFSTPSSVQTSNSEHSTSKAPSPTSSPKLVVENEPLPPPPKKIKVIPWEQAKLGGQKLGQPPDSSSKSGLRQLAKLKWESPEDKLKKYETRQHQYHVQKMAYADRFKKMKTMVRNVKVTENQMLPPREEIINLFEQVSIFQDFL